MTPVTVANARLQSQVEASRVRILRRAFAFGIVSLFLAHSPIHTSTILVHGIPGDSPTYLKLHDTDGSTAIIVPDSVDNKWAAGAQVVVTSNEYRWHKDSGVIQIVAMDPATETGYTRLTLSKTPLSTTPSTEVDDIGFAVEVALLSRNVVFDSESSDGGHFWVFQTPHVTQNIEGVEVVNFGQAGTLGRYPIHFHLCRDVAGSVVKKNTVRHSNQRCFVIHGSDNLLLEDNVAYNTPGHCYMLEDVSLLWKLRC